ncbi:hypothetical protein V6Z12_A10G100200 [Gossypium hirsutum]
MASKTPFGASNIPRIIIISTITIAITILLWSLKLSVPFFFYPQPPIIKLNNLLVSNFKVLDSNLVSIWLGNITVYNPNIALSIHTNQLEASILYKHDYPLSLTTVDNLELYVWEKRDVFVKFVTTGNESDQPIIEYPLMKEIEKDWRTGKLSFRIWMSLLKMEGGRGGKEEKIARFTILLVISLTMDVLGLSWLMMTEFCP